MTDGQQKGIALGEFEFSLDQAPATSLQYYLVRTEIGAYLAADRGVMEGVVTGPVSGLVEQLLGVILGMIEAADARKLLDCYGDFRGGEDCKADCVFDDVCAELECLHAVSEKWHNVLKYWSDYRTHEWDPNAFIFMWDILDKEMGFDPNQLRITVPEQAKPVDASANAALPAVNEEAEALSYLMNIIKRSGGVVVVANMLKEARKAAATKDAANVAVLFEDEDCDKATVRDTVALTDGLFGEGPLYGSADT